MLLDEFFMYKEKALAREQPFSVDSYAHMRKRSVGAGAYPQRCLLGAVPRATHVESSVGAPPPHQRGYRRGVGCQLTH